eukprot:g6350.t1
MNKTQVSNHQAVKKDLGSSPSQMNAPSTIKPENTVKPVNSTYLNNIWGFATDVMNDLSDFGDILSNDTSAVVSELAAATSSVLTTAQEDFIGLANILLPEAEEDESGEDEVTENSAEKEKDKTVPPPTVTPLVNTPIVKKHLKPPVAPVAKVATTKAAAEGVAAAYSLHSENEGTNSGGYGLNNILHELVLSNGKENKKKMQSNKGKLRRVARKKNYNSGSESWQEISGNSSWEKINSESE